MARARSRLVTLTTDIGSAYAAQMKGVLYRSLPAGSVVDLTHEVRPHAIAEGAFLLRYLAAPFPSGSVHVAVVDPGVGSRRAPIAVRCRDRSFLVGPDNGVLMPLAQHLGFAAAVKIRPERLRRSGDGSPTFDGRDVFAPAAAWLAQGRPFARLGDPWTPQPGPDLSARSGREGWSGRVAHIDRFGNVITTLPGMAAPSPPSTVEVRWGRRPWRTVPVVRTYADLRRGETGLLTSSFGLLELCVREGSAARRWTIFTDAPVRLRGPAPARRDRK